VQQQLHPASTEAKVELLTHQQREQMIANGRAKAGREQTEDFAPVVRLLCPWNDAVWLLTELDPDDPDIAFGLCDLGMGFPELGTVRLSELAAMEGPQGLRIQRDESFTPTRKLSTYAYFARRQPRSKE
jgi:hypothetical protein